MTKTAIQLYTLRNLEVPLSTIIHTVSEAGFDGVEFATRIHDADPNAVRDALDATGIEPVGAHVDLKQLHANGDRLLDLYESVGCSRLIIPHISSPRYWTAQSVSDLATELSELAADLDSRGMDLGVHNTREMLLPAPGGRLFEPIVERGVLPKFGWNHLAWLAGIPVTRNRKTLAGRTALGRLAAATTADQLFFEPDLKGITTAGFDPGIVLDALEGRTPLVHVADVARSRRFPPAFEPVDPGEGIVDVHAAIAEVQQHDVEWLVYEHDDPMDPRAALRHGAELLQTRGSPDSRSRVDVTTS